jgi:hypothetical protein
MSCTKSVLGLIFVATLSLGSAEAQQPSTTPKNPPAPTGSVTGYVVYAESQLPARFAEIRLVPKPSDMAFISLVPIKQQPANSAEPPQTKAALPRFVVGSTGMDGTFRLDGVPPGDYFVTALKPGYVTPGATMPMTASGDQLKRVVASLAVVTVGVGQVASVNLTLHRGAVISGRMRYADGSPAIGMPVSAGSPEEITLPANARNMTLSPLQDALQSLTHPQAREQNVFTDDEGRFRMFGLPPGKYLVGTMIALDHNSTKVTMDDGSNPHSNGRDHMYPEMIFVYGPKAFRRKDARVFDIRGDEQITDADLTIDPDGLHTLKGRILAGEDRHAPSAMVRLREDGAKDMIRFVEIEDDGSFQINYLPPGGYTLEIIANDIPNLSNSPDGPKQPQQYKTVKLGAIVGDHDVILDEVLMTPLKPGERNPDFEF